MAYLSDVLQTTEAPTIPNLPSIANEPVQKLACTLT